MTVRIRPRAAVVLLCGTVFLSGLTMTGCSPRPASSIAHDGPSSTAATQNIGVTRYATGSRPTIPDLSGRTLDGNSLRVSALLGQVVVLNAWASYCGPCQTESPELAKTADHTQSLGVRFVGIDEQDHADDARSFAKSAGATYPELVDEDGALLASLRLVPPSAVPSTLVLDRSGRVAARVIGAVDESTFEALVRELAAEKPTPASS